MNYRSNDNSGITIVFILIAIIVIISCCMRSCSEQNQARSWGGTMEVELEPNDKLLNVTWKDDSLWILTKKMTENDVAEEYRFYEKDSLGVLEGTVILKETKLTSEELATYEEQKVLAIDYSHTSNFTFDENYESAVVYIQYDAETGTYKKIKDYVYDEYGNLIPKTME